MPTVVVNFPNALVFVQPESEIIVRNDIIPNRRVIPPTLNGISKSDSVTGKGKPSVVSIRTFVIENTVTKKKLAANTAAFKMVRDKRVLVSETKKFATTAIENPANNELITII